MHFWYGAFWHFPLLSCRVTPDYWNPVRAHKEIGYKPREMRIKFAAFKYYLLK